MKKHQTGMTAIGWLITLAFGGMFLFAGLRLGPVYLEHMKVNTAMKKVAKEMGGNGADVAGIKNALAKRYNVEGITHPDFAEFKFSKAGSGIRITAKYDHVVPYLSNVSFLVAFDDYVDVPR